MEFDDVMRELAGYTDERTRAVWLNHGAPEPLFGVKVGDLKKIMKKTRKNQELAARLFDSGNADAMYLACLIAEEKKITEDTLRQWGKAASWYMVSEYGVAAVAAEAGFGMSLGLEWIDAAQEHVMACGWAALAHVVTIRPDDSLDLQQIGSLLQRVKDTLDAAPNRVRYTMNGFVIAVGCCVAPLSNDALAVADSLGKVSVDLGGTACKVPDALQYIEKVVSMGRLGKKKKKARC